MTSLAYDSSHMLKITAVPEVNYEKKTCFQLSKRFFCLQRKHKVVIIFTSKSLLAGICFNNMHVL